MSLKRWAEGPDSYAVRPAQPMTPELEAEFIARQRRIRMAFTRLADDSSRNHYHARMLGYVEGLGDGVSFGIHGTTLKNHLLTLGDLEAEYLGGEPESEGA